MPRELPFNTLNAKISKLAKPLIQTQNPYKIENYLLTWIGSIFETDDVYQSHVSSDERQSETLNRLILVFGLNIKLLNLHYGKKFSEWQ